MSENTTKTQHLKPWACPKCGEDCSGNRYRTRDGEDSVGYVLTCKGCGCGFTYWESLTYAPYGVEVDGHTYEFPPPRNENDVSSYVDEYQELAGLDDDGIIAKLSREHDWTPETSEALLELAQQYGAFILRHALAVATVLDIEDGSEGL